MRIIKSFLIILLLCLFISCATTITVQVKRPAQLDLNGAKTIAVLPFRPYQINDVVDVFSFIIDTIFFDYDKCNPDEKKCLDRLKNEIEIALSKSPYISLINSSEVQRAIKNNYLNPADVYLMGEVINFCVNVYRALSIFGGAVLIMRHLFFLNCCQKILTSLHLPYYKKLNFCSVLY